MRRSRSCWNRFVASLARPGGNITGLSTLAPELSGKRLELLKEIVPKLSRVAVLGTSTTPDNAQMSKRDRVAARAFGVTASIPRRTWSQGYRDRIPSRDKSRADAFVVTDDIAVLAHRTRIVDLAVKSRLPAMYYDRTICRSWRAYELRR